MSPFRRWLCSLVFAAAALTGALFLGLWADPAAGAVMPRLGWPASAAVRAVPGFELGTGLFKPASAALRGGPVGARNAASGVTVQSVAGASDLFGVACASATSCLAVGQNGSGEDVVVPISGGVAGAAVAGADQVFLSEIACVSASSCIAVGATDNFTEGIVVPVTDGVPGSAQLVPGTGELVDVACDPSGACVADGLNDQFSEGVVVPVTGGTPGAVQPVPSAGELLGITCPTNGSCFSTGVSADFSTGVVVPIQSGVAGTAEPVAGTNVLVDVDCSTATVCSAVGTTGVVHLAAVPVLDGAPGAAQTTPNVPTAVELGQQPSSLACVSSQLCLVAGTDNDQALGDVSPIVDGSPGMEQQIDGTQGLFDLACPAGGKCVGVGAIFGGGGAVVSFPGGSGAASTTTVTISPAHGSFGQTARATATVSSTTGTPTGLVYFAIDGVYADYPQPLDGSGKTVFAMRGLGPGDHTMTATYMGPTGAFSPGRTFYQSTSSTGAVSIGCSTTVTGQRNGSIDVTQPATCFSGATVSGSVNVERGASLSVSSSAIAGSVNAVGTGTFRMCGSTVRGSLNITNARGYVLVGDRDPNDDFDGCDANTIGGSVNLANDANGATMIANTIGGALDTRNVAGAGGFPFELAPELAPNTVNGQSTFLATRQNEAQGQPVDGIQCGGSEQLVFHYHAHLAIFANGQSLAVPEGVGMVGPLSESPTPYGPYAFPASGCLYWVHVHDQTGMIHLELPVAFTATLGDFFDIWGQPLTSTQVGPEQGRVTAFADGARYKGNPRDIVLSDHTRVQLDIRGPVVPPQPFEFTATNR